MVRYVVRFHNLQTPLRIFQITHQGGQNTYSSMKLNTEIEYQPMLFSLMETGILTQTVQKKIRQTYLKAWVFATLTLQEECLNHSHSGTYSGFFILLNTDLAPFFTSFPAYSGPFFTSFPAYSEPFFTSFPAYSEPFFTSFPAYSEPFFTSFPAYSEPFFILDIF